VPRAPGGHASASARTCPPSGSPICADGSARGIRDRDMVSTFSQCPCARAG
jgi:hypothetical protein